MHLHPGTKRAITLAAIAAVMFTLLGVSSAVADVRPKATMVRTIFDVTQTSRRSTTCTGQDGPYEELRQTFSGSSTADFPALDPYLTGTLFIRSKLLRNTTTGVGTFSGTAYVISSTTHTVTVVGRFLGATDGSLGAGGLYEALVTGPNLVSPPLTDTRGKLIGNFDISFASADLTSLNGTFGGFGNPQRAAVVVQGSCEHDTDDIMEEVD